MRCTVTGEAKLRKEWFGEGERRHSEDYVSLPVRCPQLGGWQGHVTVSSGNYSTLSDGSIVIDGKVDLYLPNPRYLEEDGSLKPGIADPGGYSLDGDMVETIVPSFRGSIVVKNAKFWEQEM